MKNAEEFIKALAADRELAEKTNDALSRCKTEEEAVGAIVEFAKTRGYEFDAEEFTDAKIREMSDEDLDKVAGGAGNIFEDMEKLARGAGIILSRDPDIVLEESNPHHPK